MKRHTVLPIAFITLFCASFCTTQLMAQTGETISADIDVKALENSWSGGQGRDTDLNVTSGDRLTVTVNPSQTWSAGNDDPCTRTSNADGLTECYGPFSSGTLSANYGSLVGRIGNGEPFLIGTAFDQEMTGSGPLLLYYWDSNAGDNSGAIVAVLRLEKSPQAKPDLRFVSLVSGAWQPLAQSTAFDQPLAIEVDYETPQEETTITITAQLDEITLEGLTADRVANDPSLYRTRQFTIVDGAPSTLVYNDDPEPQ